MAVRTYAWIARQPYNVRYRGERLLIDNMPVSERFVKDNNELMTKGQDAFKLGEFWPSLILVEKNWEGKKQDIQIYIRVFKRKINLIVDLLIGTDMDLVVPLSEKFKIPIYQISTSKKGKRGSVQKLLNFQG